MSLGTLSEKRTLTETTKETPKPVETVVVKVAEEKPPLKEPIVFVQAPKTPTKEPVKEPTQDTKCAYCMAEKITTLAIRGGIVLVLLALCFNLIKSASK